MEPEIIVDDQVVGIPGERRSTPGLVHSQPVAKGARRDGLIDVLEVPAGEIAKARQRFGWDILGHQRHAERHGPPINTETVSQRGE